MQPCEPPPVGAKLAVLLDPKLGAGPQWSVGAITEHLITALETSGKAKLLVAVRLEDCGSDVILTARSNAPMVYLHGYEQGVYESSCLNRSSYPSLLSQPDEAVAAYQAYRSLQQSSRDMPATVLTAGDDVPRQDRQVIAAATAHTLAKDGAQAAHQLSDVTSHASNKTLSGQRALISLDENAGCKLPMASETPSSEATTPLRLLDANAPGACLNGSREKKRRRVRTEDMRGALISTHRFFLIDAAQPQMCQRRRDERSFFSASVLLPRRRWCPS